jgi:excinuclease UvrABC helicase subunit UvrB
MKPPKTFASSSQKESFRTRFAEIVSNNEQLADNYKIQFFDTAVKSNYAFNNLNGKTINIMEHLTINELENYRTLKNDWQR